MDPMSRLGTSAGKIRGKRGEGIKYTHHTADAVKNTWFCGHIKELT